MIKREWFISTEIRTETTRIIAWRLFTFTSLFSNRVETIEFIINEIAEANGVKVDDISIISFNRV